MYPRTDLQLIFESWFKTKLCHTYIVMLYIHFNFFIEVSCENTLTHRRIQFSTFALCCFAICGNVTPPPFFFFKVLAFSQNVCCPVARGENYGSFIYIYTYLVCTNTSRSKLNDISSSYEIIQLCCWTQKYLVVVLKHIVDIGLLCPDLGHSWTLRF